MNKNLLPMATAAVALVACSPSGSGSATSSPSGATASPSPSVPPAPTSIASTSPTVSGFVPWIVYTDQYGIRLVHPDGSGDHALPGAPAGAQHPDWSSDGRWLTFIVDEDDSRDIWISDVDGGGLRRLVDCEAPCVDADGPAFSPDGKSIAYRVFQQVDGAYPGSRLETVDVASGESRLVATTDAPDYIGNGTPIRWSPDGKSLLMDVSRLANAGADNELVLRSDIAVVSVEDAKPTLRRITDVDTFPTYADWNPTKELIVFMARVAGNSGHTNLFTIRPDGLGLAQLTSFDAGHDVWGPTWSPDGMSIWVTIPDPEFHLGRLDADDSGLDVIGPGRILGAHPREQPMSR